ARPPLGRPPTPTLGKEGGAAEDDRITIVFHQVLHRFLDPLPLPIEISIHELADSSSGIEDHETLRKHFVKLIAKRIAARWSYVSNASAPSIHSSILLMRPFVITKPLETGEPRIVAGLWGKLLCGERSRIISRQTFVEQFSLM